MSLGSVSHSRAVLVFPQPNYADRNLLLSLPKFPLGIVLAFPLPASHTHERQHARILVGRPQALMDPLIQTRGRTRQV